MHLQELLCLEYIGSILRKLIPRFGALSRALCALVWRTSVHAYGGANILRSKFVTETVDKNPEC